jgi:hypothetical protein
VHKAFAMRAHVPLPGGQLPAGQLTAPVVADASVNHEWVVEERGLEEVDPPAVAAVDVHTILPGVADLSEQ